MAVVRGWGEGGGNDSADVIKLKVLKWDDDLGFSGWSLNAITYIFMRYRGLFSTHRKEGDMKVEQREILKCYSWWSEGCSLDPSNVGSHQNLEKGWILPRPFGGIVSLLISWFQSRDNDFGCLAFRTMNELIPVALRYQLFDHLS